MHLEGLVTMHGYTIYTYIHIHTHTYSAYGEWPAFVDSEGLATIHGYTIYTYIHTHTYSAYGEWPAFVDPEGLVTMHGEPVALCPGGAHRRLALDEGTLTDFVQGVVDLWL